jgi:hypothetical protein
MKNFILFIILGLTIYWFYYLNNLNENFEDINIDNSNYQHDHRIHIDKYTKANIDHNFNVEYPLPLGSWKEKCELINWKHPLLWVNCLDDLRHPYKSSINVHKCENNPIHVDNGNLDCD